MVVRAVELDKIDAEALKSTFNMKQVGLHKYEAVGEEDRNHDSNGNWIENNNESRSFLDNYTRIDENSKRNHASLQQIRQGEILGQCESPSISTNQNESTKSSSTDIIPPISHLDQYIDEAAKIALSGDYQSNFQSDYRNINQESSDSVSSLQSLEPDSSQNNMIGHNQPSFTFNLQNQQQQQPISSAPTRFQRIQDECRIDPSFIHTLTHPNQSGLSLPQYPTSSNHQMKPDPKKRGNKVTLGPDGSKRYECYFKGCGRSFSTSGHLTRHFKIHTGEKSHGCYILHCPSVFSRKDNMIQHFIAHQKKLVAMNAPILLKVPLEGGYENQSLENGNQVVKPKRRDRSTSSLNQSSQRKKTDTSNAKTGDMTTLFWHGDKKGEAAEGSISDVPTRYRDSILSKSNLLGSTASTCNSSGTNSYSNLHHPQPFFANQTLYQNYAPNRYQPSSMYMYQESQSYQPHYQQSNNFMRPRSITTSQLHYSPISSHHDSQFTSCLSAPPSLNSTDGHFMIPAPTQQSQMETGIEASGGNIGTEGFFRSTSTPATLPEPNLQPQQQQYGGVYHNTSTLPISSRITNETSTTLLYNGSVGSGVPKEWRNEHHSSLMDHRIDPFPSIQSCINSTTTTNPSSLDGPCLFSISGLGQMSSPMFSPLVGGFVMHSSTNSSLVSLPNHQTE